MESYELPHFNKPGGPSAATPVTPAPGYDSRTDNHIAGIARNHYYQVPVEAPRAKPWYKRKACIITTVVVGIILLLAAIAVGLAVVFLMKDKDDDDDKGAVVTTTIPVFPTTTEEEQSTMTITSRTTITASIETVTLTKSAEEDEEPTTIIRTITATEPEDMGSMLSKALSGYPFYTTELTTEVQTISNTIEQTVTREVTLTRETEPEPTTEIVLTTQVITLSNTIERTLTTQVTVTEEEEVESTLTQETIISLVTMTRVSEGPGTTYTEYKPTTITATATLDSPSTSKTSESSTNKEETSTIETTESSSETSSSTSSIFSSSSSDITSSTTSSSSSTTSSASPTPSNAPAISNSSSLAAVDVITGPSSLKRRLMVWQDDDKNLIARSSSNGYSAVYNVNEAFGDFPKAKGDTPLTVAADEKGAAHVFYMDEDNNVHHISQSDSFEWEDYDSSPFMQALEGSPLAATFHQSANETNVLVLSYFTSGGKAQARSQQKRIEVFISSDNGFTWTTETPGKLNDPDIIDADGEKYGLAVVSGIAWAGEDMEPIGDGEYAGLHFVMEGKDSILVFECGFDGNELGDCEKLTRKFNIWDPESDEADSEGYKPIEAETHPLGLGWSYSQPNATAPATIYGIWVNEVSNGRASDYNIVTGIEGESEGGTTEIHESMAMHELYYRSDPGVAEHNWVTYIAATRERVVFTRHNSGMVLEHFWDPEGNGVVIGEGLWDRAGQVDTGLTEDMKEEQKRFSEAAESKLLDQIS